MIVLCLIGRTKRKSVEIGVDFFEDGVTVELGSLHDRIVSCGPDRPILHELNFVEFLVFDTWIDPEFVHDPN